MSDLRALARQFDGFILRDARECALLPSERRCARPGMRFQTLMVRSAATPRVSNHEATIGDRDSTQPEQTQRNRHDAKNLNPARYHQGLCGPRPPHCCTAPEGA